MTITEDLTQLFFINFIKSNYASGLDWQGLMKKAGVSPYKRIYEISVVTSQKAKNVELLKVEPVAGQTNVSDKVLPFIEELFIMSGEDRKASLVNFYDYVDNKKQGAQLQLEHVDSTVTLITAAEHATTTAVSGYKL